MEDLGNGSVRLSVDEVDSAYNLFVVAREWNLPDLRMIEDFKLLGYNLLNGVHDQGTEVELAEPQVKAMRHTIEVGEKLGRIASELKAQLPSSSNDSTA